MGKRIVGGHLASNVSTYKQRIYRMTRGKHECDGMKRQTTPLQLLSGKHHVFAPQQQDKPKTLSVHVVGAAQ